VKQGIVEKIVVVALGIIFGLLTDWTKVVNPLSFTE
jgi:hypothetical protein